MGGEARIMKKIVTRIGFMVFIFVLVAGGIFLYQNQKRSEERRVGKECL